MLRVMDGVTSEASLEEKHGSRIVRWTSLLGVGTQVRASGRSMPCVLNLAPSPRSCLDLVAATTSRPL